MTLVRQLRQELIGGRIVSTEFYKKQRAAYVFVKSDKSVRALGFVYHPAGSGCFCVPGSKIRPETAEKPWPMFGISQGEIIDVRQFGLDRLFELIVKLPEGVRRMAFEAIGPNGNVWLLAESGVILKTLRNKEFGRNEVYTPAPPPDRFNPLTVTAQELLHAHGDAAAGTLAAFLKKALHGLDETLARELVVRAGLQDPSPSVMDTAAAEALVREIRRLAERFTDPESGYLYEIHHAFETYPFKLACVEAQPEKYKSLSLAVLAMTERRQTRVTQDDEEKRALQAVSRALKRVERRIENIRKDITEAADFDRYKRFAELLQLHRDQLTKGMTEITVEDLLSDDGPPVRITLDPALSPNDNIEAYFKRHRKGREGLETLERRLHISEQELVSLQEMLADLETDFANARERYAADILALLPAEAGRAEPVVRLPYRVTKLTTGLTVFIGRDGADNDRTTFEFAKPYELWFHTQQCSGSHVIIKYPNKSFEPSRREIEEAASLAAWHSKARNNKLVPVVYTERRYVRKPRKAKPGLVTVEREKSVMVEPRASFE